MRTAIIIMTTLAVCWLQIYFLPAWRPWGVVPNLLIVWVVAAGLKLNASRSLQLALGAGLLTDLASGVDFGWRTAFFGVLALSLAVLERFGAELDNLGLVLGVVAAAALIFNLVILANLLLDGVSVVRSDALGLIIKELTLDLVLVVITRPVFNLALAETRQEGWR